MGIKLAWKGRLRILAVEKKMLQFKSYEALFEFVAIADIHFFDLKADDVLCAALSDAQMELAINGYKAFLIDAVLADCY